MSGSTYGVYGSSGGGPYFGGGSGLGFDPDPSDPFGIGNVPNGGGNTQSPGGGTSTGSAVPTTTGIFTPSTSNPLTGSTTYASIISVVPTNEYGAPGQPIATGTAAGLVSEWPAILKYLYSFPLTIEAPGVPALAPGVAL